MITERSAETLATFNKFINEGRLFLKNQSIESAVQSFEKAFEINGNSPELSFVLAKLFQIINKTDRKLY
jgi:cytochrome c-type biogenesis protein CcmH/NrfG